MQKVNSKSVALVKFHFIVFRLKDSIHVFLLSASRRNRYCLLQGHMFTREHF